MTSLYESSRLSKHALWPVAGSVAMLLLVAPRYGFHRDELYFVVAGRNLDWGYVDQPPFTPLVARAADLIAGPSPLALRVLPAIAVGAIALMAAFMAKRLGGRVAAQVYAATSVGFAGVVLGEGHLLSTAIFDFAFWTAGLLLLVHILGGGSPRLWLAVGAVVGFGLQNKHTMAFFAVAVLVGILATKQRRVLGSRWPWLGAGLALVIALPNLVWQAQNGFPQLEMAEALQSRSEGPLAFLLFQPLLLSVALAIPAAIGLWRLATHEVFERWRPLAIAYGVLFVAFLVTGGKAYYIAPMYSVLLATGSLWFDGLGRAARWVMGGFTGVGLAVGMLIGLPLAPVTSVPTFDATGELGETVGWPELIDQVTAVYESIPARERPRAVILTSSYGEAGAVDVLGAERRLPPAVSGHNNYYLWGPPESHGAIVGVGQVSSALDLVCSEYDQVATISNPYGVENEEAGLPIYLCLEPERQLADYWQSIKHFN